MTAFANNKDNFISEMNTFFNESPKCHLCRYIFDNNILQFYLGRPLNYIYKPSLSSLILRTDSNCTNLKHDGICQ
jgi:hypothetical protein